MSSIEKRAVSGGFANLLVFIFTFIQSILLVPVFLNNWGKEKYGIWIAVSAFFALVKTFDLGHQIYIGNELLRYYRTDINKAKEILASGIRITYFIGAADVLVGMVALYFFSPLFWDISRSQEIFSEAYYGTFALLLMWMFVGSVGGIWSRVLVATGQLTRSSYWALIFKIAETAVLLYAALSKASIFLASFLLAVMTLVFTLAFAADVKRNNPAFFPYKSFKQNKTGYQNFLRSIIVTVSGIADQFGNNLQIAFVSNNLGRGTIPVLTTLKTLTNTALQVVAVCTGAVTVDMIRLYIQGDKDKIPEILSVIWLIILLTIYMPFVLFTPFVESIYKLWTHNLLPFNKPLYYLLTLSICFISFGTSLKQLLAGINHLRSVTIMAVARFLILCIIPFGIKPLGLTMVGIAVFLSEAFASAIIPFLFLQGQLKIFNTTGSKKTVIVSLVPLLIVAIFLLLVYVDCFSAIPLTFATLLILLMIGVIHWNLLRKDIRQRILVSVVSRFKSNVQSINNR